MRADSSNTVERAKFKRSTTTNITKKIKKHVKNSLVYKGK